MILAYFTANFVTLMIVGALIVMMAVNRKLKIPATQYFYVMIAVILLLTVLDFLNDFLAGAMERKPDFNPVRLRAVVDAVNYMLRPVVIMVEVLVVQPKQKNKWLWLLLNLQSGGKAEDMRGASRNPSGLTCSQMSLALKHHRMALSLLKTIEW